MCRNIIDPLVCFLLFIKDEIIAEMVKWINLGIVLKRKGNLSKLQEQSTDELFNASFSSTRYVIEDG